MDASFNSVNCRISLCHADSDLAHFLSLLLVDMGYQVDLSDDIRLLSPEQLKPSLFLIGGFEEVRAHFIIQQICSDLVFCKVPILFLSNSTNIDSGVRAIDCGADDFVIQPFSIREILSRIKSLIRRTQADKGDSKSVARYKNLSVDKSSNLVKLGKHEVSLTKIEFEILVCILESAGRVITKKHLKTSVYNNEDMSDANIHVHVRSLKNKIAPLSNSLKTVRGVGYRLSDLEI